MFYLLIGGVVLFDFVVFKMASKCSRIEEKMYLDEFKKNID